MAFEKDLPVWRESGSEVPENIKNNGWSPEDKPAAQHLNNVLHKTYEVLKELQENAAEKDVVNQQLAHIVEDNAISPEDFNGTDYEKVQAAINYAITNKKAIRFTRLYDITGFTLNLDKADDRWMLVFYGFGGGIQKNDAGFMFNTNRSYVGDILFSTMAFQGVVGGGIILLNADKIIRVKSSSSIYRNIDTIAKAVTNYIQSYDFVGDSIVGGQGSAIIAPATYSLSCTSVLCEHRENFFEQIQATGGSVYNSLYQAKFRDCMIEGLSGFAFKIRNTTSLVIDGNYFERNNMGHIDFRAALALRGVSIANNRCYEHPETYQQSAFILWSGNLISVESSNNYVENTPVHDVSLVINNFLLSRNDVTTASNFAVGNTDVIIRESNVRRVTANGRQNTSDFGFFTRYYNQINDVVFLANEYKTVIVSMPVAIAYDDLISIQLSDGGSGKEIFIGSYQLNTNDRSKLNIRIKNNTAETVTIEVITVTVLKPKFTVTG